MSLKSMYHTHCENVAKVTQLNHERQMERNKVRNSRIMTTVVAIAAIATLGKIA